MKMKSPRNYLACEGGGAAVETALVFPVFLLLLLGVIELGLMLWTEGSLQYAAESAARCASVDSTQCGSASAIETYAINHYFGPALASVNPFTYSTTNCGHTVTVSYTYTLGIPYGAYSIPLSATACYP
jgi:TadE-like protein